jgi:hypothetical protein
MPQNLTEAVNLTVKKWREILGIETCIHDSTAKTLIILCSGNWIDFQSKEVIGESVALFHAELKNYFPDYEFRYIKGYPLELQ